MPMQNQTRRLIVEHNIPVLESLLIGAASDGADLDEVVAFIVDASDEHGGHFAHAAFGPECVRHALAAAAKDDSIPTLAICIPRSTAAEGLARAGFPEMAERLKVPATRGMFWVVCIADGGASTSQLTIPVGTGGKA